MTGIEQLMEAFQSMMTHHRGMFLSDGAKLFQAFAVILLVLLGMKFFEYGDLHTLWMGILQITACYIMIHWYVTPAPGLGTSFSALLVDPGRDFAGRIMAGTADDMNRLLSGIQANLDAPGLFGWLTMRHIFAYVMAWLAIGFFMIMELFVCGIGFFGTASLITIGPILIPWLLFPGMDWVFWSWLRCLISFSFVGVFAALFIDAYASLIMNFVGFHPGLSKDPLMMGASLGGFVALLIAGGGVGLMIPSITAACFTGGGGGSSFWQFWRIIPGR